MRLLNNLYIITERDSNSFQLHLNKECAIYKAHFPEQPITPGVCIIQIASELLEILMSKPVVLKEVVNAKFLSVINPIETPIVKYNYTKIVQEDESHKIKVSIIVSSQSANCAKLSLLYSNDE